MRARPLSVGRSAAAPRGSRNLHAAWSADILTEVERTLVAKMGRTSYQANRRVSQMQAAFPDAEVTGYQTLVPAMTNDPKDAHVLAAAVAADAAVIVTANLKDFPAASVEPYDIEVLHPDDFLLNQLDLYPDRVAQCIREQRGEYRKPELTYAEFVTRLKLTVPQIAAAVAIDPDSVPRLRPGSHIWQRTDRGFTVFQYQVSGASYLSGFRNASGEDLLLADDRQPGKMTIRDANPSETAVSFEIERLLQLEPAVVVAPYAPTFGQWSELKSWTPQPDELGPTKSELTWRELVAADLGSNHVGHFVYLSNDGVSRVARIEHVQTDPRYTPPDSCFLSLSSKPAGARGIHVKLDELLTISVEAIE